MRRTEDIKNRVPSAAEINSIDIAKASNAEWMKLMVYIRFNIYSKGCHDSYSLGEITSRCTKKAWENAGSYNPNLGKLTTWLQTVMCSCMSDYFHEEIKRPDTVDLEGIKEFHETHPKYDADSYDCNEAINLLYKFASKQTGEKRVLTLMVLRDCDNHEIAERLGVKPNVVEIRKSRLKTEMRAFLKLNGYDYLPLTA